jgi:hypothetical protein
MFCTQCGAEVATAAKFCGRCGKSVEDNSMGESPVLKPSTNPLSSIGNTLHIWRDIKIRGAFKTDPPAEVKWIGQLVDVVFTDDLVVVLPAPEKSKLGQMLTTTADRSGGVVGGAAFLGGPLLALALGALAIPTAIVASCYEKRYRAKNDLDARQLETLFDAGFVIYAKKCELRASVGCAKEWFGALKSYWASINGVYHTTTGPLDLRLIFTGGTGRAYDVPCLTAVGFKFKPARSSIYPNLIAESREDASPDGYDHYWPDFWA